MKTEDPTTINTSWFIDIDAKGNAKIEIKNIIENQSSESIPVNKPYRLIFPESDIIKEKPIINYGNSNPDYAQISRNEISTNIIGNLGPKGTPNSKIEFAIKFPLIQNFANVYDGILVINRLFIESAFYSPDILMIEFRFSNPKNKLKKLSPKYGHQPRGTEEDRNQKGSTIIRFSQGINRFDAIYPYLVDFTVISKYNISIIIAFLVSIGGIILTIIFYNSSIGGFISSIIGGIVANYLYNKISHD